MNLAPTRMDVEAKVREAASCCLRVPAGSIDRDAPLTRYGLDSLNAVELAVAITECTGRDCSSETLLDYPSVGALTDFALAPAVLSTHHRHPLERMLADCALPGDIEPRGAAAAEQGAVLLTGATGFLGSHLLAALLCEATCPVICLVRAASDADAAVRLQSAARRHATGVFCGNRVEAVAGDIETACFGMPPETYSKLCERASSIVHCAAAVDWSQRYEALREPNVLGTVEVLRFACAARRKTFHFVSSLSVCYSSRGPKLVCETDDRAADPAGIHFGYAQSKWVAEALVREAGGRGLDVAIYRPDLIAGHSVTGEGNDDDFFARLVKGCIALGAAPDLAWRIDACPVDFVATAIARLARSVPLEPVSHLMNPRSGRWLEVVLWMRLRGYRLRLLPFAEWRALADERSRESSHPLHALRGFLLDRPSGEERRSLPDLYAEPHRAGVDHTRTERRLASLGVTSPPLGARLLETWFAAWERSGFLSQGAAARRPAGRRASPASQLEALMEARWPAQGLRISAMRAFDVGGENSILGELTSWHAGSQLELRGYTLEVTTRAGASRALDVVLKPRPDDEAAFDVACEVASLCSPRLGAAFAAHWRRTPFAGTAAREIALYGRSESRIASCAPDAYGVIDCGGHQALVLEHVSDVAKSGGASPADPWCREDVETALAGIVRVHAAWYGRETELLAADWLGPILGEGAVRDSHELWLELAEHARPWVSKWVGAPAGRLLCRLAHGAPARAMALAAHPRTLVHHDFNPRNIGLRRRQGSLELCAFDWELATLAVPQRDLAELLCFVLPPRAPAELVLHYAEHHRRLLERATGTRIDRAHWLEGLRLALEDFAVQRLTMYSIAYRLRSRAFIESVARTWAHLMSVTDALAKHRNTAPQAA